MARHNRVKTVVNKEDRVKRKLKFSTVYIALLSLVVLLHLMGKI